RSLLKDVVLVWAPYMTLVVLVLAWGYQPFLRKLNTFSVPIPWSGLHNMVQRVPPVVQQASGYAAVFNFNWLSASGTACLFAAIIAAVIVGLKPSQFFKALKQTARQLV